jgi:hypothetical protein
MWCSLSNFIMPSASSPLTYLSTMRVPQLTSPIAISAATIIGVALAHYILITLYTYLCIPVGLFAPLWHIMRTGSPFCYALNTLQYELSRNYALIWAGVAGSIVTYFITKLKLD